MRLHKASCLNNNLCSICNSYPETHLHRLRDCNFSRQIWNSLHPSENTAFFNQNFQKWLITNRQNATPSFLNIPWETIFLYTIREIWLNRNRVVFQSTHSTLVQDVYAQEL